MQVDETMKYDNNVHPEKADDPIEIVPRTEMELSLVQPLKALLDIVIGESISNLAI